MVTPGDRAATPGSLPDSARARLDRLRSGAPLHTSYLTSASAAALRSVGFTAAGDVMGCATSQISSTYVPTCRSSRDTQTAVRTGGSPPGGGPGYLGLVRGLYAKTLRRLADEAVAMGADGVVGITLTSTERDQVTEVVALGTGVRAGTRQRAARPFTTDLAATDVAKLLGEGWAPVSLHVAAQIGVRHLDPTSAQLMRASGSRWTKSMVWAGGNAEVAGPSELVHETKAATRSVLAGQIAAVGADGCLLSRLDVTIEEKECQRVAGAGGGGAGDLVGLGVAIGTSITRIADAPAARTPGLMYVPLNIRGGRR